MMSDPHFKWDDSYLIGIEELDHEHKALIDDINRLHEELTGQGGPSEIEKCLGEIHARMQAHFALEENVMQEHEYPYLAEHKAEHDELLDSYTESMLQLLNDTGPTTSLSIQEKLQHWVMVHIGTSDKKMSLMVQETQSYKSKP